MNGTVLPVVLLLACAPDPLTAGGPVDEPAAGGGPFAGVHAVFGASARAGVGDGPRVALALSRVGREDALGPVAARPPATRGPDGRASWTDGGLTEWWAASGTGYEQGVDWIAPPVSPARTPLVLEFTVEGATLRDDGAGLLLLPPRGPALRYDGLVAWDADGRALPAWIERGAGHPATDGGPDTFRLYVDDAGARPPIHLDPTLTAATWTGESDQSSAGMGDAVAIGDLDGDGYGDLIVGASGYTTMSSDEGQVWVYAGSGAGPDAVASWTGSLNQRASRFGAAVASAGDVDGDGDDELLVGAPYYSNGDAYEGVACVYLGSSGGLSAGASWTAEGDAAYVNFGSAVAGAGDVDGDGYDDVLIGAPNAEDAVPGEGTASLYDGGATGLGTGPTWTVAGGQRSASLGSAVAGAGDVNGDGYADVLVGVDRYDGGESDEGEALLWLGSATGPATTPDWAWEPDVASASAGAAVAPAGDVDGDGYADIVVGAPDYVDSYTGEGGVFVFLGSSAGPSASSDWDTQSRKAGAHCGTAVAAGDADGDGYADLLTGAPDYRDSYTGEGQASLFDGSRRGPAVGRSWRALGGGTDVALGTALAMGDVNGDGYADVLVGAPGYDGGESNEGGAFLYPGYSSSTEICNGLDDDGNGVVDDSPLDPATFYADSDGDGYGDPATPASACDAPSGYVEDDTDCDDRLPGVHPGATETCDAAATDEDCDGVAEESGAANEILWHVDSDGDGWGAEAGRVLKQCAQPDGYVDDAHDCNDGDATVNPAATEVCDGDDRDEDCDRLADDADGSVAEAGKATWWLDADGDGHGATVTTAACDQPPGYTADGDDCDDADPRRSPALPELCDADDLDEDCDGLADDADVSVTGTLPYYPDGDGDGYGSPTAATTWYCDPPAGLVQNRDDCDDVDPAIHPDAVETDCTDPTDYNCDGSSDYVDADGDGSPACEDCNDRVDTIHPGATETCDQLDDDCNGAVDDGAVDATLWGADEDHDGYTDPGTVGAACTCPLGEIPATAADCDDGDAEVYPGAPERLDDGVDQDCDGEDGPAISEPDTDPGCGCAAGGESSPPPGLALAGLSFAAALLRRRPARVRA